MRVCPRPARRTLRAGRRYRSGFRSSVLRRPLRDERVRIVDERGAAKGGAPRAASRPLPPAPLCCRRAQRRSPATRADTPQNSPSRAKPVAISEIQRRRARLTVSRRPVLQARSRSSVRCSRSPMPESGDCPDAHRVVHYIADSVALGSEEAHIKLGATQLLPGHHLAGWPKSGSRKSTVVQRLR